MKTYITTDTHFCHEKVKEYCGRPENFEDLVWNSFRSLRREHILIHLGDVCWYNHKKINNRIGLLPCKKILVLGNHDKKSYNWYMNNGWDFVCETFSMERHGKIVLFSHEPKAWDGYFDINICGHLHNSQHRLENELKGIERHGQYVLSLEDNKYKLWSLDKIVGCFK